MLSRLVAPLFLAVVLLFNLSSNLFANTDVVAVSNTANRTIHLIEVSSGEIRQTVGVHANVSGIAADDENQIFYYTDQARLYRVPYQGGESTEIGTFGGASTAIFGLAYDTATNNLYGCFNAGIYEINRTNAQTTLLFDPPGDNLLSGIDIDETDGQMYLCDDQGDGVSGPGIYKVDLNSQLYSGVHNPYPGGSADVDGFAVRDGIGYLIEDDITESIYEIRMADGVVTRTFPTPYSEGSFNSAGAFASIQGRQIPVSGTLVPELFVLDSTMLDYVKQYDIGGTTLAVMRNGTPVYHRSFGWSDSQRTIPIENDTTMRVASVTKPLTAAAIRKLVAENQIALSDFVFDNGGNNGILNYTPFGTADPRIYSITIEHLLQHFGGWDRGIAGDHTYREIQIANEMGVPSPPGRQATARWIMGQPLQYDPGTTYAYSNIGFLLLGLVVEEITGTPHMDYIQQNVFAPLGVPTSQIFRGNTFFDEKDPREPWYNHNGYLSNNVFFPASSTDAVVPAPYGGWDHEARVGQGAVVANPLALLAYLNQYQVSGSNIGGLRPAPGGWRYNHTGALTGTNSLARQRGDGINYVVLFNKRQTYGSGYASEIRTILDTVFDGISNWPTNNITEFSTERYDLTLGSLASGDVASLSTSDNSDLSIRRSTTDVSGRVIVEFFKTSPVLSPTKIQFDLESSVFARRLVVQHLDIFNFDSGQWETLSTRNASQFTDSTINGSLAGNLSGYVNPTNRELRVRCRYESDLRRQNYSANLDFTRWNIE